MPSAALRRFAVASLGIWLAVLASHAMRAQQAQPASQPVGPTGTIAGRVINAATGAPAGGLEIEIVSEIEAVRAVGRGRQVQNGVSVVAGADGRYVAEALPVGDYYVRTASINRLGLIGQIYDKVPYWGSFTFPIQGAAVTVNANRVTSDIDFALEPGGALAGTIRNGATGVGVPDATVRVVGERGGVSTTTDAGGSFRVTGMPSGSYALRVEAQNAGLVSAEYPPASNPAEGDRRGPTFGIAVKAPAVTAHVDVMLQPGATIAGRVTDKTTGKPVADVEIQAGGTARTNADGEYAVRGLPSGSYTVLTRVPSSSGYIDQLYDSVTCWRGECERKQGRSITVSAPETRARINFELEPGARIAGRVTNAATGAPVAGVSVSCSPTAPGLGSTTTTDAQGRYVSAGLLPGAYYVRTVSDATPWMFDQVYPGKPCDRYRCDVQTGTPVVARNGATTGGVDFALSQGGSISGVVTEAATGAPIRGVRVMAKSPARSVYGGTDAAGRYTIYGLATGNYRIVATPAWEGILGFGMRHALFLQSLFNQTYGAKDAQTDDEEAGTPVAVTAPGTVTGIDFALVRGGIIRGTITNARTGEPVAGVSVRASDGNSSMSDGRGRFEVTGLHAGNHRVWTEMSATRGIGRPLPYLDQAYRGVPCLAEECARARGALLSVGPGQMRDGVDFRLAEGGVITGAIIDPAIAKSRARGQVTFYSSSGVRLYVVDADATGRYVSGGLPTGTYFAIGSSRTGTDWGIQGELYKGRPCLRTDSDDTGCDVRRGTPIVVTAPQTTSGVDFALTAGGTISGVVTEASTGKPVPGARVSVTADQFGFMDVGSTTTDAGGRYSVAGLPDGTYYLEVNPRQPADGVGRPGPKLPALLSQVYPGVGCSYSSCRSAKAEGRPVALKAGAAVTGIDFPLGLGGTIAGRVVDASTSKPLRAVSVCFHKESGAVATCAGTDSEGSYTSPPLPPGSYYLRAQPADNAAVVGVLYPNVPYRPGDLSVRRGTPVSVSVGEAIAGKDFALAPGGVIKGKVTRSDSGRPVKFFFIRIYTHAGVLAAGVIGENGEYVTPTLAPGTYFATTAAGEEYGYVDRTYDGIDCAREACRPTAGTPIVIGGPGIVVTGIDFTLRPGPEKSNTADVLAAARAGGLRIEPASGPSSGGSLITILGGPFEFWATTVQIGGVPAVSVETRYVGLIKVVVPPGKPGPADVVVTSNGRTLLLPKGYTYLPDRPPGSPRR